MYRYFQGLWKVTSIHVSIVNLQQVSEWKLLPCKVTIPPATIARVHVVGIECGHYQYHGISSIALSQAS